MVQLPIRKTYGSGIGQFRTMTAEEAKSLSSSSRVWAKSNNGEAIRVKVNGAPKTWKRQPERVEVPVKFGLYECARVSPEQLLIALSLPEGTSAY